MFVSGMGFFTDAYDLFVIGIVVVLLKPEWHLSTGQVSWLNSATLLASAFGAVLFGRIADILGRKRIYGYEVLILAIGALASAFAPNYTFLLICRVILGIGIGGDYPVSATIMSEYSGKKPRGRMVGLVFAMQGGPHRRSAAGLDPARRRAFERARLADPAGPGCHPRPGRVLPAAADPRDAAVRDGRRRRRRGRGGDRRRDRRGCRPAVRPESKARHPQTALGGFMILARSRRMLLWLVGTAGCWALLDFCYYGKPSPPPRSSRCSIRTPRCCTTRWSSWASSWCSRCPATSSRSCCSTRPGAAASRCSDSA